MIGSPSINRNYPSNVSQRYNGCMHGDNIHRRKIHKKGIVTRTGETNSRKKMERRHEVFQKISIASKQDNGKDNTKKQEFPYKEMTKEKTRTKINIGKKLIYFFCYQVPKKNTRRLLKNKNQQVQPNL